MITRDTWTHLVVPVAVDELARADMNEPLPSICERISARTGLDVTAKKLEGAFAGRGMQTPANMRARRLDTTPAGAAAPVSGVRPSGLQRPARCVPELATPDTDPIDRLVKLADKGASFSVACDVLDMSPSRVRALVERAAAAGYRIGLAGDAVARTTDESTECQADIGSPPVVNGRAIVAVISDTHFGSKYCLREPLREFIQYAYSRGARHVLHCGDVLDGCYDHGRWELSHHGVDDQINDCLATLPQLPGLEYHYISGNHDETYTRTTGLDTGRLIEDRAHAVGRTDLHYHGCRGALLRLGRVKVELWHPRSGKSYALSYQLQNKIRDMPSATNRKPDLLFAGHWHISTTLEQRAVHASAVPCWQSGESAFGRSLGGSPSIGGLLVSWETTEGGTLRRVAVERSAYYEVETWREIA